MNEILIELNFSPPGFQDTRNGHQGGGFSSSIGTKNRDDFSAIHFEGNPSQCLEITVKYLDALDPKHLPTPLPSTPLPGKPR